MLYLCFLFGRYAPRTGLNWACLLFFGPGPTIAPQNSDFFISLRGEKRGFDVSERMGVRRAQGARADSYFGRATNYEARPFISGGVMSPSSNGVTWIERPSFFLVFLGRGDLFSLLPAI